MADALAAHQIRLPLALNDSHNEIGVVRDADGMEVFTVNTEGTWPDHQVLAVAALLIARLNAQAPRSAVAATESALTALDAISTILAPIAESSAETMTVFQIAEDARAELHEAAKGQV
ncbi:hypothetical protein OPKNFCMD_3871 [Methylobacterium crusticola]|uniref:Uncharacterized protein n=1 Tax=Methylobacterium crusticola TaxID=1697972 RepID=A0ABQ4R0B9_9HYPH|nr:hypothetical protein [Methylobacterium crusticola]GJD51120.1 hypothetical protein OPKNFCMD_3871 [Methylobacterium crusticola]